MKLLTGIFTRDKNLEYFKNCLRHWQKAHKKLEKFPDFRSDLMVIDFSKQPSEAVEEATKEHKGRYHFKKQAGFASNVNSTFGYAIFNGYDLICLLNDDTAVHQDFLVNGIEFLQTNPKAGFVGGNEGAQGWLTPIDKMKIPEPNSDVYPILDFKRLWWEFSACILRVEAVEEAGYFDTYGDPTGYCCDNAYLLMMKKAGWSVWHSGLMPFAHHRGLSQQEHRLPGGNDPIRDKMVDYLKQEYGIDISGSGAVTHLKDGFPLSQSKKTITFLDLNEIMRQKNHG